MNIINPLPFSNGSLSREHPHRRLPSLLPLFKIRFEYTIQLDTDYTAQKKTSRSWNDDVVSVNISFKRLHLINFDFETSGQEISLTL